MSKSPTARPPPTDLREAITVLCEELTAMLDHLERAAACEGDELERVLEVQALGDAEHAIHLIDWLRRNTPAFGHHFKRILVPDHDSRPRRRGELSDAAAAELIQRTPVAPIKIV